VIGSNVRKEVPLIAHRIRQAAVRRNAKVALVNPEPLDLRFPVLAQLTSNGLGMAQHVAAVLVAALRATGKAAPSNVTAALEGITPSAQHEAVAAALAGGELKVVLLGALAQRHVAYSEIRALAQAVAHATGARLGYLPEGGNGVGAVLAGALAHRTAGGVPVAQPGLGAAEMLAARLKAYVMVGGIESADLAPATTTEASLRGADCVVAVTPYASEEIKAVSTVILPSAAFAETSGTWVNVEGRWQSVPGASRPAGEARPAWKILRVLGNLLALPGFEHASSEDVRDELRHTLETAHGAVAAVGSFTPGRLAAMDVTRDVGLYRVDAVVRRSAPLQATADGLVAAHPQGGNA
jgi:NADH-quinone oxidoreductase subunit G